MDEEEKRTWFIKYTIYFANGKQASGNQFVNEHPLDYLSKFNGDGSKQRMPECMTLEFFTEVDSKELKTEGEFYFAHLGSEENKPKIYTGG